MLSNFVHFIEHLETESDTERHTERQREEKEREREGGWRQSGKEMKESR